MKALQRIGVTSLAAALSAGATVVAGGAALAQGDDNRVADVKREDSGNAWVMSTDDDGDDDDTNTGTNTNTGTITDTGAQSNDNTGSRVTAVSRDNDHSVDDVTKDWTRDGGGERHRDFSANLTNDHSRHDTRGR